MIGQIGSFKRLSTAIVSRKPVGDVDANSWANSLLQLRWFVRFIGVILLWCFQWLAGVPPGIQNIPKKGISCYDFPNTKKKHGEKQNEKESWKTSVSEKDRTKLAVVEKWKFPRNHRYLRNLHQELEISGFHHFFGVISLKFPNSWPLIMIRSWHLRNSKVFTWMTLNVIRMTMAVASWDLKTCLFGLFF